MSELLSNSPHEGFVVLFQTILLYSCVAVLIVIAGIAAYGLFLRVARILHRALNIEEVLVLVALAGMCTWAAQKRLVRFPRTDPTTAYLIDQDSYVESDDDTVHINFSRFVVPDSANLYIDRIQQSNGVAVAGAEFVNHMTIKIGEANPPIEFVYPNATNFLWMVYTDWTPGPSVQTNGVWHANWGRDTSNRGFVIPVRTQVRLDGEVIADPKSRENSNEDQ